MFSHDSAGEFAGEFLKKVNYEFARGPRANLRAKGRIVNHP